MNIGKNINLEKDRTIPDISGRDVLREIKEKNVAPSVGAMTLEDCIKASHSTDAANEVHPYFA